MRRIRSIFANCSLFLLLQAAMCYGVESIQQQIASNRVASDKNVVSADHKRKLSMQVESDGVFSLIITHGKVSKVIDQSPKPDFRICWSEDENYMVIVRPVGFTTMVKVYSLDRSQGEAREIFASEKVNQRNFVDYGLQRWDLKHGFVVFNVYENSRYLEGRKPRLLATEYIYLDGQNAF